MPHTLLWADRARELNPKAAAVDEDLRKPDPWWAVKSHLLFLRGPLPHADTEMGWTHPPPRANKELGLHLPK